MSKRGSFFFIKSAHFHENHHFLHTSCLKICNGQTAVPNYIHIYFHRALYLIVQCIFGWDWSITKLITPEFLIKWTQFFIKSTKIGVFYQYGYTDITKNRDPWICMNLDTRAVGCGTWLLVRRTCVPRLLLDLTILYGTSLILFQ